MSPKFHISQNVSACCYTDAVSTAKGNLMDSWQLGHQLSCLKIIVATYPNQNIEEGKENFGDNCFLRQVLMPHLFALPVQVKLPKLSRISPG